MTEAATGSKARSSDQRKMRFPSGAITLFDNASFVKLHYKPAGWGAKEVQVFVMLSHLWTSD